MPNEKHQYDGDDLVSVVVKADQLKALIAMTKHLRKQTDTDPAFGDLLDLEFTLNLVLKDFEFNGVKLPY